MVAFLARRVFNQRRKKRRRRRRSCVGGFVRFERCGAIISMPSGRNAWSSGSLSLARSPMSFFRLGFDHVEVEAQLYGAHFVMVRGVGADRERQAVAIHDRHDFHAFSTLGRSDLGASALAITKVASMKHSSSSSTPRSRSSLAMSMRMPRRTSLRHQSESGDEPFCSSDSTAGACAIARRR